MTTALFTETNARPPSLGASMPSSAYAVASRSIFGAADRAVAVDRPSQLRANVGVRHGARAGREQAFARQRVDPHAPIFAAHHRDCVGDLFFVGRDASVTSTTFPESSSMVRLV